MTSQDINAKTQHSAKRAAINDAKQKIVFRWKSAGSPRTWGIACDLPQLEIYEPAVKELSEQYLRCYFHIIKVTTHK